MRARWATLGTAGFPSKNTVVNWWRRRRGIAEGYISSRVLTAVVTVYAIIIWWTTRVTATPLSLGAAVTTTH